MIRLRYRADGYLALDPGPYDSLLIIEVADTSLQADRQGKIPLYARSGIPEAWLVNLPGDEVEPHAACYREVRTAGRGDTITPLAFPGLTLRVDEILGPKQLLQQCP